MKGTMQEALPWLFWTWCYSHRLELACKDALSSRLFKDTEEMLLRLYLIHAKSPKKSRELSDIASDLKEFFELSKGGNLPVQFQGSQWISHKRSALQRLLTVMAPTSITLQHWLKTNPLELTTELS